MVWAKRHGIMLCQPLDDHNLARNWKLSPFLLVQPKLDGMRCWVDWDTELNWPTLVSSQGNPITSCLHIQYALRDLAALTNCFYNFDGELYSHSLPFEEIISLTRRADYDKDCLRVGFHIFDYKAEKGNGERQLVMSELFEQWRKDGDPQYRECLQQVETIAVRNNEEIDHYLARFVNEGYEGIIVRNPMAPYVEKRPFTILKWKPSRSDWYEIIEASPAIDSKTGQDLDYLGSLTCKDRFNNRFNVGTGLGMTLPEKQKLWAVRAGLPGLYAKITYQNLTSAAGVPRFGKVVEISETSGEETI